MINKEEIAKILMMIAVEHPREVNTEDEKLFDMKVELWSRELSEYDINLITTAVLDALKSSRYCPKLANIIERIKSYTNALTRSSSPELDWNTLRMALHRAQDLSARFHYTAKFPGQKLTQGEQSREDALQIYNELPDLIQDYCGGFSEFLGMANLSYEDLKFEKHRFISAYERLEQRQQDRAAAIAIREANPNALPEADEDYIFLNPSDEEGD